MSGKRVSLTLIGTVLLFGPAWARDMSFEQSRAGYERRKMDFLMRRADAWRGMSFAHHVPQDEWKWDEIAPCWIGAHACLALKRSAEEVAKANQFFEAMPIDWNFDPDMQFLEILHSYFSFRDDPALSKAARQRLEQLLAEHRGPRRVYDDIWDFHTSENHAFMGHVWRLLTAQILNDEAEFELFRNIVSRFIIAHVREGWVEFASPCYVEKEIGCLLILRQWCQDQVVRQQAELLLDALFAEYAALCLDQMYCGPSTRTYGRSLPLAERNHNSRRDSACDGMYSCGYLLFGTGDPAYYGVLGVNILATSDYDPPDAIVDLAVDRRGRGTYEFRSRKHGGARVYCYCTPSYILGVSIEAPGMTGMLENDALTNALVIRGSTRKILFTETGGGATVFQHQNVLIGRGSEGEAYFPLTEMDRMTERGGWIFCQDNQAYVAYRVVSGGYTWRHVESESSYGDTIRFANAGSPFILEVASPEDYGGSFDSFMDDVLDNPISHGPEGTEYESCSAGQSGPSSQAFTISLPARGLPLVNGQAIDLDWPLLDCPYVKSAWGSGVVEVAKGARRLVLDLSDPTAPRKTQTTVE